MDEFMRFNCCRLSFTVYRSIVTMNLVTQVVVGVLLIIAGLERHSLADAIELSVSRDIGSPNGNTFDVRSPDTTSQRTSPLQERQSFGHSKFPFILTADRKSGTVTVINSFKPNQTTTINLGKGAEPMYISVDVRNRQFWVADRATSKLIKFKYTSIGFIRHGSYATANGTFHTMSTQDDRTFFPLAWTSCDIDRVTTVHLMTSGKKLATIPTPSYLATLGAFPHDIAVAFRFGFVTYIGASNGRGYVAAYDAFNFKRLKVLKMSQDPHVAIRGNSRLFVAAQGGDSSPGRVYMLSVPQLEILATDRQPSPHGICVSFDERLVYVTNIAQGGDNAIIVYEADTLDRLDCGNISTSIAVPHNVAQSYDMTKLYITHSLPDIGAVSVFDLDVRGCPVQSSLKVEQSGHLAFGIAPFSPQLKIWRYFN